MRRNNLGVRTVGAALAILLAALIARPASAPVRAAPTAQAWGSGGLAAAAAQVSKPPRSVVLASAVVADTFEVVLTADRGPDRAGAATATVFLAVHQWDGATWQSLGQHTVGHANEFFLGNVTGSLCLFSLRGRPTLEIGLRFLAGQSAGCDPTTFYFHVENGGLVPGRARS